MSARTREMKRRARQRRATHKARKAPDVPVARVVKDVPRRDRSALPLGSMAAIGMGLGASSLSEMLMDLPRALVSTIPRTR